MKTIIVTGGAGFIGSNFILRELVSGEARVVNLDSLTYAGNPLNLQTVENHPLYSFVHGDIRDRSLVRAVLEKHRPDGVVHFAAESHVDRSIVGPDEFIQTNIVGTFSLLEESCRYREKLSEPARTGFRFLHVSTDEVYGSLGPFDPSFHEQTPYDPSSPYSASKAASDHLVRAYFQTYGLPTLITNCSNNYGPRQFPEKLIPLMVLNGLDGKPMPIYGDGLNVRDWLYVSDHCDGLRLVLAHGRPGETYNIGGRCEKTNIEIVHTICRILDERYPDSPNVPHASRITFVKDRPGHDRRYSIDCSKIEKELGWRPGETLESGLEKTIRWYVDNPAWVASIRTGSYREWMNKHYSIDAMAGQPS